MKMKDEVISWLDKNQKIFTDITDEIWKDPEVAYKEFKASKLQADYLEKEGFKITWDIGGLNTAFKAEWGNGGPILGLLGEYDALPGLSQKNQAKQEPVVPNTPGHGCGHNLLGGAGVACAAAVKRWLESTKTKGVIRYYGCPAEELLTGKTFMAKSGTFNDLDAAFGYHPAGITGPSINSSLGLNDVSFSFFGKTAHAAGDPHQGRSALDAVELMNVGVNYLREHVRDKVRIHYVIKKGGDVPNIVPQEAEVWYFVRANEREELDQVTDRIRKIAQGAAMMTDTQMKETFNGSCSAVLPNHYIADLLLESMKTLGPLHFTKEEKAYAKAINDGFPKKQTEEYFKTLKIPPELEHKRDQIVGQALLEDFFRPMDETKVMMGSTDVGDVSWITPLGNFYTACCATGATGHSWGVAATCGMSIGHKGMMYAAKVMAITAIDMYTNPQHIKKAKEEFLKSTEGKPYVSPIPDDMKPPMYPNPYREK